MILKTSGLGFKLLLRSRLPTSTEHALLIFSPSELPVYFWRPKIWLKWLSIRQYLCGTLALLRLFLADQQAPEISVSTSPRAFLNLPSLDSRRARASTPVVTSLFMSSPLTVS